MRLRIVLAVIGVLALAGGATAQTTTGTISGRVLDIQEAALPGTTVTATSPNLQGKQGSGDLGEWRLHPDRAALRPI